MKYIRTKTKIETIETKLDNKELFDYLAQFDNYKDDLIKVADTIEEACDEFVLVAPYRFRKPKTATELEKDLEEMKCFYTDKDDTIYGAIWTDKGLIYVAKMNDEGELELL